MEKLGIGVLGLACIVSALWTIQSAFICVAVGVILIVLGIKKQHQEEMEGLMSRIRILDKEVQELKSKTKK